MKKVGRMLHLGLVPSERGTSRSLRLPSSSTVCSTSFFCSLSDGNTWVGPYSEQSNRVIRKYGKQYEEYFMRVLFTEEGGTQYRFDYEVDNQEFVRERVGTVLKHGLLADGFGPKYI